jgi:hypothetical protein
VKNAIRSLLPQPALEINAPSSAIATLNQQPAENRWVLHLLHYIPERRGTAFDVIEDIIPLNDIAIRVRTVKPVKQVRTVPEGQVLPQRQEGPYVAFTLPRLAGHQMIAIDA